MSQDVRGIVTVDLQKCLGCRYCEWVCPYSAPQYDEELGQMTKCDFCREELENDGVPSCVGACPTRALQFGEYDELATLYDPSLGMAPLPPPALTEPNFILEPHRDAKPGQTRAGALCNPEEVKDV
jgi:anaerobic dimethyl sulfoxide reductase subunit B (iron-sulfur subunit)